MLLRRVAATFLLASTVIAAPAPKTVAPPTMPHPVALFLANLSSGGKQRVTYRATAVGTRFFFEEPPGVTVYSYDGVAYRKEAFLKGATLTSAIKRYDRKK